MHEPAEMPVRVLFVDDEENILKSLGRLFMDEDFEVITAPSAGEGLRILMETRDVGVVVSDQRMPGMTGVQFLEQVRGMVPEALRIMLTGYADLAATVDAINRGGAGRYITKPWNDEELVQTIRDAVKQYRLVQENRRLAEIVQQQNEELQQWNANLRQRVLDQTVEIRKKNEELQLANEQLRRSNRDTIEAFSRLVELRGSRLKNHANHVAELAVAVARELGMPAPEVETIQVAALLHDIGEIGLPEELLGKRIKDMEPDELRDYLKHSVRGQTAVDAVEDLREAGLLIRHHHENYDGSGLPDGLAGEAIPLGARIIAMADYIDGAMENLFGEKAVANALWNAGREAVARLDPRLLPLFTKLAGNVYQVKAGDGRVVEVELRPESLIPGVVLARDVHSGTGMLLLAKGTLLDEAKIVALKRYYRIDPPAGGVAVMMTE